ncbi:MAG TPA: hypothetical protein VMM13_20090 [Euzebya sp.]|nr:hypothetical protein [Euzebya sp.]
MLSSSITQHVAKLNAQFSVEVTPHDLDHIGPIEQLVPPGTAVYITYLERTGLSGTIVAARRLAAAGMRPVPHLAARAVQSRGQLADAIRRMVAEAGVDDVLVIAGTVADHGPFPASIDLLRSSVLQDNGIGAAGVAGHPEGAPDIPAQVLAQAIDDKNAFARESGMALRLVTQFAFDAAPFIAWERAVRLAGNRLPVHVGLPGATDAATLVRYGLRCGVGPSLKVLRRQALRLGRLASSAPQFPDQTVTDIARAASDDPENLFTAFHYFPFGALARTGSWAAELGASTFIHTADGRLITPSRPR